VVAAVSVRVAATVRIDRPPHDVFEFIATPENLPRWDPAIRSVRRNDDGAVGVGSGLSVMAEEAGRRVELDTRVTDFEPDRLFGVAATYSGIPLRLRWRLQPEGEGTVLTSEGEADVGGFMALAGGLITGMVQERLEAAHRNLKRILENAAA
jgi:carbon monoxide dehydrogenase subunit G